MTTDETLQRVFALVGAGMDKDPARIALLTEDLDADELRAVVRAFAIFLGDQFRRLCPDRETARALLSDAAIRAALGE